jgi:hypothetical protein
VTDTFEAKSITKAPNKPPDNLPPIQHQAIEEQSQENPETFLQKFANQQKAKNLICDADSDLRKQYDVFGALKKKHWKICWAFRGSHDKF